MRHNYALGWPTLDGIDAMKKVTKAVFPVAGLGTRFLPATKASPKEMMPIVDKPLIQYAVEEAVAAGIKDMIFVTGRTKRVIEDHFDKAYELESELALKNKTIMLEFVRNMLPKDINCIYIRQSEALGLGHAVLCAKQFVGDEPFAVMLGDDVVDAEVPALKQLMDVYAETGATVLGVQEVSEEKVSSYGIVAPNGRVGKAWEVADLVEKPAVEAAPSRLAILGRYIIDPAIFAHLEHTEPGKGGEIQLTDALKSLLKEQAMLAYPFAGRRYDVGDKMGFLEATIDFALKRPELHDGLVAYMRTKV